MSSTIVSSLRSPGWKFPYRSPAAKGAIEKTISGIGGLLRGFGAALDHVGSIIQGPGALHETGRLFALLQQSSH